jgi:hypothetical protein
MWNTQIHYEVTPNHHHSPRSKWDGRRSHPHIIRLRILILSSRVCTGLPSNIFKWLQFCMYFRCVTFVLHNP